MQRIRAQWRRATYRTWKFTLLKPTPPRTNAERAVNSLDTVADDTSPPAEAPALFGILSKVANASLQRLSSAERLNLTEADDDRATLNLLATTSSTLYAKANRLLYFT
jgi:hypothetical protein